MRTTTLMAVTLMLAATPVLATKVYKWVDPAGRIHFADQPQPGWKAIDLNVPGSAAEPSAPAPGAAADGDAKPATGGEQARLAPNPEQCEKTKRDLDIYNSSTRIVERDALGRDKEYSEQERTKLIELTQQKISQLCASK